MTSGQKEPDLGRRDLVAQSLMFVNYPRIGKTATGRAAEVEFVAPGRVSRKLKIFHPFNYMVLPAQVKKNR
jgi:hypothetical protein